MDQNYSNSSVGFLNNNLQLTYFTIQELQEKSHEQRLPMYIALEDLPKAFDLINQGSLCAVLLKSGCLPTFLALINLYHDGIQATVPFNR